VNVHFVKLPKFYINPSQTISVWAAMQARRPPYGAGNWLNVCSPSKQTLMTDRHGSPQAYQNPQGTFAFLPLPIREPECHFRNAISREAEDAGSVSPL